MKLRMSCYSSLTPIIIGGRYGFVIQREKAALFLKREGEVPQEVCLIVGGEPVGSELVGVAWGSAASGTVGGFVTFCLFGGSAISAG